MLLKTCTISNLKEQFILAEHSYHIDSPDLVDPTGPAQLEIVDCVIMKNKVSGDQPFISIGNAYFTMINCLYTGNNVTNHILLKSPSDVTNKNVSFYNNSLGGIDDPANEKALLIVNNTVIKIENCNFESNNLQLGSLILVFGSVVRVMNTVIGYNYNTDNTYPKIISTHDSKTVEFSNSKFLNDRLINTFKIRSSTFLLIDSCLFQNYFGVDQFDIWNTYDVILQKSTFYHNRGFFVGYVHDVNSLRIFRCYFAWRHWSFSFDRYATTKIFVLDSDVKIKGLNTTIVTEGSPYASGGYKCILI